MSDERRGKQTRETGVWLMWIATREERQFETAWRAIVPQVSWGVEIDHITTTTLGAGVAPGLVSNLPSSIISVVAPIPATKTANPI